VTTNTTIQKPEWSKWLPRKRATLAEGILLAHNVCPNSHVMTAGEGLGQQIDESKWELLQLSYNWLEDAETSWVRNRGPFPRRAYEVEIDLPSFFKWLVNDVDWKNLPVEILNLVLGKTTKNLAATPVKPWLVANPKDPAPKQPWYVAARYFARELVKGDTSLLQKPARLRNQIHESMKKVGVYKRGGVLAPDPGTIQKALTGIELS
jgi:hypothetical protein